MKVAIIGSGIAGLASAYLLSRRHDITLFEAADRIGGHTHTVDVTVAAHSTLAPAYRVTTVLPNFIRLCSKLSSVQPTQMSSAAPRRKRRLPRQ